MKTQPSAPAHKPRKESKTAPCQRKPLVLDGLWSRHSQQLIVAAADASLPPEATQADVIALLSGPTGALKEAIKGFSVLAHGEDGCLFSLLHKDIVTCLSQKKPQTKGGRRATATGKSKSE